MYFYRLPLFQPYSFLTLLLFSLSSCFFCFQGTSSLKSFFHLRLPAYIFAFASCNAPVRKGTANIRQPYPLRKFFFTFFLNTSFQQRLELYAAIQHQQSAKQAIPILSGHLYFFKTPLVIHEFSQLNFSYPPLIQSQTASIHLFADGKNPVFLHEVLVVENC